MASSRSTVSNLAWVVALSSAAFAEPGPNVVRPWDGTGIPLDEGRPTSSGENRSTAGLQSGADHIVSQQCGSGGFGWPHNDCGPTPPNNITSPICVGLLDAHQYTSDADHLTSATNGGDWDLAFQFGNGEARFSAFTAYFMLRLTQATSDNQYSNHAATEFFDELFAATYGPSDLNTVGWIAAVQAARAGTWINLLPWEFHNLIPSATAIGNAGQSALFTQALLDGLNTLDNTDPGNVYSDLLGLAGGVRGLALGGTTSFAAINSPNHSGINGISTLKDLADQLVAYQNGNGSWYWHSNLGGPAASDEDTQTTAYAVLALVAADPLVASNYAPAMQAGRNWIYSMQLGGGGFLSYPGGDENTEVEGEALSALAQSAAVVPAVSEWGLVVLVLLGLAGGTLLFGRVRRMAS